MDPTALHVLLGLVLGVAAVVGLVSGLKVHAFPALLLVALALALYAGLSPAKAVAALSTGFGQTLGGVGPVLGLGAMLGAMVEASGGARRLAQAVVGRFGPLGAPWATAGVALLVGAPLFFETGVVVLLPLVLAVGAELDRVRPGRSGVVAAAVPALAGLAAMHALVPPHPGPLIALDALHAPFARTFLLGALLALPAVAISGPLFGAFIARFARANPPLAKLEADGSDAKAASAGATLAALLAPVLLILARAGADLSAPTSPFTAVLDVVGAPAVALLIGVLAAPAILGGGGALARRGRDGLAAVAGVLLVIGAGGAFKQVLVESGVGPALATVALGLHASPLLTGWLMAAAVRLATGSSTVATITAAGALAAAAHAGLRADPALMVLAVGSGSLFLSHVNDAGFWLVRETLGLSLLDTFRTWSTVATLVSLLALAGVLVLAAI